jgi:phosphate starvation-inducible PhoH-like protein
MRTQPAWSDETMNNISDLLTPAQIRRLERKNKKMNKNEQPTNEKSERHHQSRVQQLRPIVPLNQKQQYLLDDLNDYDQVLVYGPAGTGKTYITTTYAAQEFIKGNFDKIIITRPTVAIETSIGFFPGTLEEKMAVWLAETINILKQTLSPEGYGIALKNGDIEIVPFEVIRGRSLNKSIILLTESQNTTVKEMAAFVTRTGQDSKVIIDGDIRQSDITGKNGLVWALDMIDHNPGLAALSGMVEFDSDDIVRSGLCGAWVKAIEKQFSPKAEVVVSK